MGGYRIDITLPFIIGALGYKSGETNYQASHVRDVLDQMIKNPVDGYQTGVQWCGTLAAPVFSVSQIETHDEWMLVKSSFPRPDGSGISLGFSWDLHASNGWRDCNNEQKCYEKLVAYAEEHIRKGNFSMIPSHEGRSYEYGPFQKENLEFIRVTSMK